MPTRDCAHQREQDNQESARSADLPSHVAEQGFSDDKLRVLQATDIVRLVADHLALKPKGREFVGLCPFHEDHKPSMCVVPHKQIYHCFSCGAGGNAIDFVVNYHQMGFREALEFLADRAAIKLTPFKRRAEGAEPSSSVPRKVLVDANVFASEYFSAILRHEQHGAAARAILKRRGVSPEIIEQFGLGAAADKWDGLALTASHKNLDEATLLAAGLLKKRDNGSGVYDAFRNRIIFPIHDVIGRVIAFGARRIDDADEPKYLNSPETPLFSKSATLYGLHHAAPAIRTSGVAIVTEGYMDTIACHQAGISNVVATLGTALTTDGARTLARFCKTVVLLFDGDEAGQRAADRAVEVLFGAAIDVKIATLSSLATGDGEAPKDPDELLKQPGGKERLIALIKGGQDALAYRFVRLRSKMASAGLSARAAAIDAEIQRLAQLGLAELSPIRQQMIIRSIAVLANVDEQTIKQAVQAENAKRTRASNGYAAPVKRLALASLSAAERTLACVLLDPLLMRELTPSQRSAILAPARLPNEVMKNVAVTLDRLESCGKPIDTQVVLSAIDDPPTNGAVTGLVAELERMIDQSQTQLRVHFESFKAQMVSDLEKEARTNRFKFRGPDGSGLDHGRSPSDQPGS